MVRTKYIWDDEARVRTEPIVPGRIIFTKEQNLYWDLPDGSKRLKVTDVIDIPSDNARLALVPLSNKFYFVTATNTLWRYVTDTWHAIALPMDALTIPEIDKIFVDLGL